MTPDDLRAARLARARRWASAPMDHYPALADEDETEETLAAEPPARGEKKAKSTDTPERPHRRNDPTPRREVAVA